MFPVKMQLLKSICIMLLKRMLTRILLTKNGENTYSFVPNKKG
ncbi:hypothetical protein SAMN05660226_02152 [Parapedobacter luteus]|uniref:Uncharacterized protein n=1 Tax=Parapedobacter luteus TaxID=623280 RepID=A0A1T5CEW7_9SPHI|nr:hypothetical protein SAMN05660226_02152 [Parapedobacter luteus]